MGPQGGDTKGTHSVGRSVTIVKAQVNCQGHQNHAKSTVTSENM